MVTSTFPLRVNSDKTYSQCASEHCFCCRRAEFVDRVNSDKINAFTQCVPLNISHGGIMETGCAVSRKLVSPTPVQAADWRGQACPRQLLCNDVCS